MFNHRLIAGALALTGLLAAVPTQAASLVIVPTFDSSITSLASAATIQSTINTVIATYQSDITTPITVYITFKNQTTGVGSSAYTNYAVSYTNYIKALTASKTSASDTTALAHLSTGTTNPVTGTTTMLVKSALAKALGLSTTVGLPTAAKTSDGTVSVNTSVMNLTRTGTQVATKYDLQTVLMHEINEVLGLSSTMGQGYTSPTSTYPSPEDLFRYGATAGTRSYTTTASALAYFSIDGTTHLDQFNNTGSGDYGDWVNQSGNVQVQDTTGAPGKTANLGLELTALDVIGYTLNATLQKTY